LFCVFDQHRALGFRHGRVECASEDCHFGVGDTGQRALRSTAQDHALHYMRITQRTAQDFHHANLLNVDKCAESQIREQKLRQRNGMLRMYLINAESNALLWTHGYACLGDQWRQNALAAVQLRRNDRPQHLHNKIGTRTQFSTHARTHTHTHTHSHVRAALAMRATLNTALVPPLRHLRCANRSPDAHAAWPKSPAPSCPPFRNLRSARHNHCTQVRAERCREKHFEWQCACITCAMHAATFRVNITGTRIMPATSPSKTAAHCCRRGDARRAAATHAAAAAARRHPQRPPHRALSIRATL
jgi:hypothetical protein